MPGEVSELLSRMRDAADDGGERGQFGGVKPRLWFVGNMGCGSYDELLSLFDPVPHDNRWHGLWNSEGRGDNDERAKEANAVAFMDSGHRCVYERYMVNEVDEIPRSGHHTSNFLFQYPELDESFRRKS